MRFAGGFEATVQVDQGFVPFEGRWQGSGVEAFSQAGAASFDMPASFSVATVVVEGRERLLQTCSHGCVVARSKLFGR